MTKQSVLYPPQFENLKDEVIGDVVPCVSKCSNTTINNVRTWSSECYQPASSMPNYVRLPGAHAPVRFAPQRPENGASTEHCASLSPSAAQQTLSGNRELSDAERYKSDTSPSRSMGQQIPAASSAVEAATLEFRRRRGRIHQARHRHKKIKGVQQLEDTLENLREEIHQLNMQKQVTSLYLSVNSTALGIAVEYFRLFRFGVRQDVPTSEDMLGKAEAMVQRSFLKTAMAADVTDGTVVGASALLASWKFMSQCLENVDMLPIRIENGPEGVLNATAKCNFTITEKTLSLAFPHLIGDGTADVLAEKLVGKKLTMDGTYQFKYDEQSGRITCFQVTPDIVTPLLRLLGNLEDVARMFDNAVITPECKMAMSRMTSCS